MKSMALTEAERKELYGGDCAPCHDDGDGPSYPYGLSVYLDELIMKKLGMDGLPPVGTELVLTAKVRVTGTSQREYERDGKSEKRETTDIQITAMELTAPVRDVMGEAAKKLYGGK